ncbi:MULTISPECIES: alpha/beta fold hydrolase [Kitasatospora]|uniref:Alpha/beta fold hydrolase n=1 Tax=Kitasatospora cathayae TaxID=3004092 RepID=A0ABY7QDW6_9ACTN|nr:alpha/beta fold hydrolase [Kitasatospora sp. HUAS 3-15]WBP90963.1 alpha/beta fold hydrolase [Kitasatospora sp. HUAS 3-15]
MGEYVMVEGLRTYCEVRGEGEPVVLLHGGGVTADSWYAQIPALAEHFRVHAPERRGHGRTPDVEGPVTTDLMAGDTIALLETLATGPVHLVGWSAGATVALRLALRRPDLVRKLVLISAGVSRDGATEADAAILGDTARLEAMFRPQYEPLSPDGPGHFPVVFAKWLTMWREEPDIGLAALTALEMPVLVLQGDDDGVRVSHGAAMAAAIPNAQFAVLPGTSHTAPLEKPHLVNRILLDFLADHQAPKLMPLGALDRTPPVPPAARAAG